MSAAANYRVKQIIHWKLHLSDNHQLENPSLRKAMAEWLQTSLRAGSSNLARPMQMAPVNPHTPFLHPQSRLPNLRQAWHCCQQSVHRWLALCSGGIVADDWTSVHWHKIEYLMTCGLKPWYLDHTDVGQTPPLPPQQHLAVTMSPEAPHVLAQPQLQQQQQNQFQPQAGQQQAWVYSAPTAEPNQAAVPQLWQGQPGGGGGADGGVSAVVEVGQPWQSSSEKWQCSVNITLINQGDFYRFCQVMAS